MKTLIAIPCMDKVDTLFMASVLGMRRVGQIHYNIKKGSLIFDARNETAVDAITQGADRVLWIDSDMVFDSFVLYDLLEAKKDIVSAVCFMRKDPYDPCIYSKLRMGATLEEDQIEKYFDYPEGVFEIEGCGLARCNGR